MNSVLKAAGTIEKIDSSLLTSRFREMSPLHLYLTFCQVIASSYVSSSCLRKRTKKKRLSVESVLNQPPMNANQVEPLQSTALLTEVSQDTTEKGSGPSKHFFVTTSKVEHYCFQTGFLDALSLLTEAGNWCYWSLFIGEITSAS